MTKILLTGITGQVGQELQTTLTSVGEVIGVTRQELDLSNPEQIQDAITQIQPNIIINAAAYTAVDKAESESELAMAINANAPKVMAEAARSISATLVHISTDYVFDGTNHTPYTEEDATNPPVVSIYHKLLGD